MAFKRRKVAAALAYVVGAGTAAMLLAAAPAVAQDMRIDVTGSNIKRIDGEGPAPVEIITPNGAGEMYLVLHGCRA